MLLQHLDSANMNSDILYLGFNLNNAELTQIQKQQLHDFLIQNRDVFAKDLNEMGHTHMHYHTINTGNAKPISAAPYRQTPQMRAELEEQLEVMERNNVIEEANSPWHSPVVLVKKNNGHSFLRRL